MKAKEIGTNAGQVWKALNERGVMTPTALSRGLQLKPAEIERAIGWLAREDKLLFTVDKRGANRMSLKEE